MFDPIALLIPTSAFPSLVTITEKTASGMDVLAPKNRNPITLSKYAKIQLSLEKKKKKKKN